MMCYTEVDNDIESLVGLIQWLEKMISCQVKTFFG